MVDSLRLDWTSRQPMNCATSMWRKAPALPPPQGTHLDTMTDGYHWTGTSSTYAHPPEGEPREIIPAEIVYSPDKTQSGLVCGHRVQRAARAFISNAMAPSVRSVLGLNPDPGPFRTRLVPGGSFETPTVFLGALTAVPTAQAISSAPGCAPCWAIRSRGRTSTIRWW